MSTKRKRDAKRTLTIRLLLFRLFIWCVFAQMKFTLRISVRTSGAAILLRRCAKPIECLHATNRPREKGRTVAGE